MKLYYKSISDLNSSIIKNLHLLNDRYDLIVGIPRSGMLAANIIALHLHLPMADIHQFKEKKIMPSGARMRDKELTFNQIKNVLIVDDSANLGEALRESKQELEGCFPDKNINYAVVYKNPNLKLNGDIYLEECPLPRIFEWNIMNHPFINTGCLEIDGVLCQPPQFKDFHDENSYRQFIINTKTLLSCKSKIGILVSNRPEKFRPETEKWLKNNSIQYNELHMHSIGSINHKKSSERNIKYKAKIYMRQSNAKLFIEGAYDQASGIARLSGKPVFCVSNREMIQPGNLSVTRRRARSLTKRISSMF